MKIVLLAALMAVAVSSCSSGRGRTTQMFPDCTQVSAEEQRKGNCMYRPEIPDGMAP
jgi:hypothetical protein